MTRLAALVTLAGLAALASAGVVATRAHAEPLQGAPTTATIAPGGPAHAPTKKQQASEAKSPRRRQPPAPGTRPARLINFYNQWTKEWLAVEPAQVASPPGIDRFLRDHFTNQPAAMNKKLVVALVAAALHFRSGVVHVVSAFRHPKYNLILRKKGHEVARDSQHSHGNAIDFYLPGVATVALHAWARAQKLGGVGIYPDSGFIHIDVGPVRTWSGE